MEGPEVSLVSQDNRSEGTIPQLDANHKEDGSGGLHASGEGERVIAPEPW